MMSFYPQISQITQMRKSGTVPGISSAKSGTVPRFSLARDCPKVLAGTPRPRSSSASRQSKLLAFSACAWAARRALACISGFSLLLFLSCQQPIDSYRELMYVNTLLDPGEEHQRVVVDRSYRDGEALPGPFELRGVPNASVRLRLASSWDYWDSTRLDTVRREGMEHGSHWEYVSDPYFPVLPCTTYELTVRWRDTLEQKDFSGQMYMTIPDTFSITYPRSYDTIDITDLDYITWRRSRKAFCYVVYASEGWDEASYPYITYDTFADVRSFRDVLFVRGGWHELYVAAWNEDMYRQKVARSDRFAVDTIGRDVIADYGAQFEDHIVVWITRR